MAPFLNAHRLGRASRIGLAKLLTTFLFAAFLAGCVDSGLSPSIQAEAPQPQARTNMTTSVHGASVALASVSGAPDAVADRIRSAFAQEAERRDVVVAEPKTADYLVRGYMNASPSEDGTKVTAVFDVFDAAKKRALRFEDAIVVKSASAGADPWTSVDSAAVGDVAAKGADYLAAFLAAAPEGRGDAQRAAARKTAPAYAQSDEPRQTAQKTSRNPSSADGKSNDVSFVALR